MDHDDAQRQRQPLVQASQAYTEQREKLVCLHQQVKKQLERTADEQAASVLASQAITCVQDVCSKAFNVIEAAFELLQSRYGSNCYGKLDSMDKLWDMLDDTHWQESSTRTIEHTVRYLEHCLAVTSDFLLRVVMVATM